MKKIKPPPNKLAVTVCRTCNQSFGPGQKHFAKCGQHPKQSFDDVLETRIAGVPCQIAFKVTGKYTPAKTNADPDSCYEAEYPDVDFEVLDRRGRPAPWLARKLTNEESQRIEAEILEAV